ncbi:MAG: glutathione S-transferase [Solirubrobacterales bacterium]
MSPTPALTLHVLPPSHPCMTVRAALDLKGLEYERVDLVAGPHLETMAEIYGQGRTTVPGLLIDEEPVHGSRPILARLEELAPDPPLFPEPIAEQVREAERWGEAELQGVGRQLTWGALHFRPEAMGTFGGAGPLDPPGVDYAIRVIRATWKHHGVSAEGVAGDLARFPSMLDHVDQLAEQGIVGGEQPNAADLQIGASGRLLLCIGDLVPILTGRSLEHIARRHFPQYAGEIPPGAFPAGWLS